MSSFFRTAPGVDLSHVHRSLLQLVETAVRAAGGVGVYVTSGYRDPARNRAAGGVSGSAHLSGDALDGFALTADGRQVPLGTFLRGSASRYGLRSGDVPGFWNGRPDPVHVDDRAAGVSTSSSGSGSSAVHDLDGFFTLVLHDLGAPVNNATLAFLKGWSMVEGTAAKNNPLATTLRVDGASSDLPGNSAHVQQYTSPEVGASATATTLRRYRFVTAALKTGSPVDTGITPGIVRDFNTWSGGGGVGYARKVWLAAQGNPKGSSAADIGSYDLANLYRDSGAKTVVDDTLAVPRFLAKITNTHNILRALQVLGGAVLVLVGVSLLARQVALAADLPDPAAAVGAGGVAKAVASNRLGANDAA